MDIIRREFKTHCEGKMMYPDDSYTWCLERPWLDNTPYLSCIPYGSYLVAPDDTGRFRYFRFMDVPMRTDIEFHGANRVEELLGCIAPCMSLKNGIGYRSKDALAKLVSWYSDDKGVKKSFILNIVKYSPFKHGKWK